MLKSTIKVLVVMAKEKTVNMFDADLNLMIHRVLNKVKLAGMIISLAVLSLPSCQNLDSIYDRLDQLETSVSDLQSTCKLLQAAYDQGKIIKSVKPLTNHDTGGWLIVFSDGSEIIVINGNDGQDGIDGITPFLKIDQEGYWTVSYDNGATFIALLDKEVGYAFLLLVDYMYNQRTVVIDPNKINPMLDKILNLNAMWTVF